MIVAVFKSVQHFFEQVLLKQVPPTVLEKVKARKRPYKSRKTAKDAGNAISKSDVQLKHEEATGILLKWKTEEDGEVSSRNAKRLSSEVVPIGRLLNH